MFILPFLLVVKLELMWFPCDLFVILKIIKLMELSSYGPDPSSGIKVQDFCGTLYAYAVPGPGAVVLQICWESATNTLTFSGVVYDFPAEISSVYATYPDYYYGTFITILGTFEDNLPNGSPFSYRVNSITEEDIAFIQSKKAQIFFVTTAGDKLELNVTSSFPASKAVCVPYTGPLPTAIIDCYYSSSSTDPYPDDECFDTKELCSIDSTSVNRACYTYSSCYTCACGAVAADLPANYRACCTTDNCNVGSLATIGCTTGSTGAGFMISGGLLATLFVALISIWYN